MDKNYLNGIFRKFGFEVHGIGYMQSIRKAEFKDDAFGVQARLLQGSVRTIFDVGANNGDTVLAYASLFPEADIYAFEPFPDTYKGMVENTRNKAKLYPFEKAVSDRVGMSVFHVNNSVHTNSLLASKEMGLNSDRQVQSKGIIEVETIAIDGFCAEHKVQQIDILKLDIQGGELAALKGAENLLRHKKIKLIYSETYFRQQYVDQPLMYDIASYLNQFGYNLQDLYSPIYGNGSIAWCDVIFLPL
jgi:FkbM family methyltransferase